MELTGLKPTLTRTPQAHKKTMTHQRSQTLRGRKKKKRRAEEKKAKAADEAA